MDGEWVWGKGSGENMYCKHWREGVTFGMREKIKRGGEEGEGEKGMIQWRIGQ